MSETTPPHISPGVTAGWEDILEPGETILWQGRPDNVVVWRNVLSVESAFGLVFGLFALFWIIAAVGMGGVGGINPIGLIFPLFGLPFLATGVWMVVGRIIWDARQRGRTWYTLTDRTAFIATDSGGTRKLETYPLRAEMDIQLEDGDPGTVWFERKIAHHPGRWSGGPGNKRYRGPSTSVTPIGFRRIDDPRRVYRLLRDRIAALQHDDAAPSLA